MGMSMEQKFSKKSAPRPSQAILSGRGSARSRRPRLAPSGSRLC